MTGRCKPSECFINVKTTKRIRKILKDEARRLRQDEGLFYSVNALIVRAIRQCYVTNPETPSEDENSS